MERKLKELEESEKGEHEEGLEDKALELAIEEVYQESGQRWRPWACNAKSLRMGDVILIVDSDTIVPEVCLLSSMDLLRPDLFLRIASAMLLAS